MSEQILDERTLGYLREHRPDLDDLSDDELRETALFAYVRLVLAVRQVRVAIIGDGRLASLRRRLLKLVDRWAAWRSSGGGQP